MQYGGPRYSNGVHALGRTDPVIYGDLDSFDIYAPAAIIQSAGGYVTDWNGDPLTLDTAGHVLAAGGKVRPDEPVAIIKG